MNKLRYATRDHEAGNQIDEFATLEEAKKALEEYISEDRGAGDYTPNFYEIYDMEQDEVVETL